MSKWKAPVHPEVRRRRRRGWAIFAGIVALIAAGIAAAWPAISTVKSPHAWSTVVHPGNDGPQPLGQPPRVRHGVGTFSFRAEQPITGDPVAYDPCRKVPYAINEEGAPAGTDRIVEAAVRQVSRATGLVFVRRTDVDRYPTYDTVDTNYGREPVIVTWTTPAKVPGLRGEPTGLARSVYITDGRTAQNVYVTGAVDLDAPQLDKLLHRADGAPLVRAAVMQQVAHVVGLDDVKDPHELMYDGLPQRLTFGPGDREGLAALGAGQCF